MKKIFTLFAVAMLGLCAYAQMPETCPSELGLQVLNGENPAQVEVELTLINSSLNLNGFNTELELNNENVIFKEVANKAFSAAGYANVILARLNDATDEEREEFLLDFCGVHSNIKTNGDLVIVEELTTNDCRFFPVLETYTAIGKFYMDWTAVANAKDAANECTISAQTIPSRYSFAYDYGIEGYHAWTPDAPLELNMEYVEGVVREKVPDAISTINTDKAVDNRIFDLQGRELQSVPEHGIYIQNGKKYIK